MKGSRRSFALLGSVLAAATQCHAAEEVSTERHHLVAGVPGRVTVRISAATLWTPGLERAGRVRLRPLWAVCGGDGASIMADAVRPPCSGSICAGPTERNGQVVAWDGLLIVHAGVYRLCWCEPRPSCAGHDAGFGGPGCCLDDGAFSREAGQVEAIGPAWQTHQPSLSHPFQLDLIGPAIDRSSRLLLRISGDEGGACGGQRSEAEHKAVDLVRGTAKDGIAKYEARLFRRLVFVLCWCPGDHLPTGDCSDDYFYAAEVGIAYTHGPETEGLPLQHAVVGASFALPLYGDRLGTGDRVRIIDGGRACGADDTVSSWDVATYVCGRGEADCVQSPVRGWPPSDVRNAGLNPPVMAGWMEVWEPVQVTVPGLYRLCWCVDDTWDQTFLESAGYCSSNRQFAVEVGLLLVQGIDNDQSFVCVAFAPCTLRVTSPMSMSVLDGVLVAAKHVYVPRQCGRGIIGVLAPANLATSATGASSNATADFPLLPHAGPPGHFRICYCRQASMGPCDEAVAFGQSAGMLEVKPPVDGVVQHRMETRYCRVGRACSFVISGMWALQLAEGDAFRALPMSGVGAAPCGRGYGGGGTSGVFSLSNRAAPSRSVAGDWEATFSLPVGWPRAPGDFRLCYCSASLAAGTACHDLADFFQDMGTLLVPGVNGLHAWTCDQGVFCNLTLPGYLLSQSDGLLLSRQGTACGSTGLGGASPSLGITRNPALSPEIEGEEEGGFGVGRANFGVGRVLAAGRFRVCFCTAYMSGSRGCHDVTDFDQNVGLLSVHGPLDAVQLATTQPATTAAISLMVNVVSSGSVTCAAAEHMLPDVPTSLDVIYCHDRIPECLGVGRLPWPASEGSNLIHVSLFFNTTAPVAGADSVSVHVWCVGDVMHCPSGRCAMPALGDGLVVPLQNGVLEQTSWHAVRNEPFDLVLRGSPLNTGGRLELLPQHAKCGIDAEGRGRVTLGSPSAIDPLASASWNSAGMPAVGHHAVCWCDRGYGLICARWLRVGELIVTGPVGWASALAVIGQYQPLDVHVTGLGLSLAGKLAAVPGESCDGGNPTRADQWNASAPVWVDPIGTSAMYRIQAPSEVDVYAFCWGEDGSLRTLVGHVSVEELRNCKVSDWEPQQCDRPCGGGASKALRHILAWPSGGGRACPRTAELERWEACNTQPCLAAIAARVTTEPDSVQSGEAFQVIMHGKNLDPMMDRVLLMAGDATCGSVTTQNFGGATCARPGSTSERLVCGDGVDNLRVDEPGTYRVCFCDASLGLAPRIAVASRVNGTVDRNGQSVLVATSQDNSCSAAVDFTHMPGNGSVFRVIRQSPGSNTSSPGGEDSGAASSRRDGKGSGDVVGVRAHLDQQDAGRRNTIIWAISGICGAHLAVALCVWWCWLRRSALKKQAKNQCKGAPVIDTVELARMATQEVWEAWQRTVAEQIIPEDVVKAEQEFPWLTDEPRKVSHETPDFSSEGDARWSGSSGDETSDLPSYPTSRTTTPLRSQLSTGGSRQLSTAGGSRQSTAGSHTASRGGTGGSRRSLLDVTLPPQGTPVAPLIQGSFLDLPLLGKPEAPRAVAQREAARERLEVDRLVVEAATTLLAARPTTPEAEGGVGSHRDSGSAGAAGDGSCEDMLGGAAKVACASARSTRPSSRCSSPAGSMGSDAREQPPPPPLRLTPPPLPAGSPLASRPLHLRLKPLELPTDPLSSPVLQASGPMINDVDVAALATCNTPPRGGAFGAGAGPMPVTSPHGSSTARPPGLQLPAVPPMEPSSPPPMLQLPSNCLPLDQAAYDLRLSLMSLPPPPVPPEATLSAVDVPSSPLANSTAPVDTAVSSSSARRGWALPAFWRGPKLPWQKHEGSAGKQSQIHPAPSMGRGTAGAGGGAANQQSTEGVHSASQGAMGPTADSGPAEKLPSPNIAPPLSQGGSVCAPPAVGGTAWTDNIVKPSVDAIPPSANEEHELALASGSAWTDCTANRAMDTLRAAASHQSQKKTCSAGHPLTDCVTPHHRFRCDVCNAMQPTGAHMSSCRFCDYDVCANCISTGALAAGDVAGADEATSPADDPCTAAPHEVKATEGGVTVRDPLGRPAAQQQLEQQQHSLQQQQEAKDDKSQQQQRRRQRRKDKQNQCIAQTLPAPMSLDTSGHACAGREPPLSPDATAPVTTLPPVMPAKVDHIDNAVLTTQGIARQEEADETVTAAPRQSKSNAGHISHREQFQQGLSSNSLDVQSPVDSPRRAASDQSCSHGSREASAARDDPTSSSSTTKLSGSQRDSEALAVCTPPQSPGQVVEKRVHSHRDGHGRRPTAEELETWRGQDTISQEAGLQGCRQEVIDAQDKIRAEWYARLAAETRWDDSKAPRRLASSLRNSAGRKIPASASAVPSEASSSVPSPRSMGFVAGPGPPLAHGPPATMAPSAPPTPGSLLPGPPLSCTKGPPLLPGPPLAPAPLGRGGPPHGQPHPCGGTSTGRPGCGRPPPSWAFFVP